MDPYTTSVDDAQKWYTFLYALALEWWFIRTVGTTAMSYATRKFYEFLKGTVVKGGSHRHEQKFIALSHLLWTVIFTWMARRDQFLARSFKDWDLALIEFLLCLCGSLIVWAIWARGMAPIMDKKFGTKFTKVRD
jgi:hypothetical protein